MNKKDIKSEILGIIISSAYKAGYKILVGDRDSVIIKNLNTGQDFEIKVEEIMP